MKTSVEKIEKQAVKLIEVGGRLVAIAAAAYFFLGPKGREHRDNTMAWAIKMKAEVIEKLETAHEISEFAYHKIIDSVAAKHEKSKKASPAEVSALAGSLKKHWKTISKVAKVVKPKADKITGKGKKIIRHKESLKPIAKI